MLKKANVESYRKTLEATVKGHMLEVETFSNLFPKLTNDLFFPPEDFRGLSITIGRSGGYLGIAKIFDAKGEPSILFASAETPFEVFGALEQQLNKGNWRQDTRATEPESKKK